MTVKSMETRWGSLLDMYCICSANCHRIDKPYITAWTALILCSANCHDIDMNPTSLLPYYPLATSYSDVGLMSIL